MVISWQLTGRLESPELIFGDSVAVDEVLYDFDGPRIFTFTSLNRKFLAYRADESVNKFRHIVCPTSKVVISDLRKGSRSVLDALDQPWTWVLDLDAEMLVSAAWQTSLDELPTGSLPKRSVMLYASLQPLFNVKLTGAKLNREAVSASVIKRAVDGAYIALKRLSEGVLDTGQSVGRPAKLSRRLFDLPAQRVAISSFEISFGNPQSEDQALQLEDTKSVLENIAEIGNRLSTALSWATSGSSTVPPLDSLEALARLAPPQHGVVEFVQVSGKMLSDPRKIWVLNREASNKIRKTLTVKRVDEEELRVVTGHAREFDKDKLSFRLRAMSTEQEFTCFFSEELYDDVMDVFNGDDVITATLRVRRGTNSGEVVEITHGPVSS